VLDDITDMCTSIYEIIDNYIHNSNYDKIIVVERGIIMTIIIIIIIIITFIIIKGQCSFDSKVRIAGGLGYKGIIVINNEQESLPAFPMGALDANYSSIIPGSSSSSPSLPSSYYYLFSCYG
jgi:hypothetical protein